MYTLTGSLQLTEGLFNTAGITASVEVQVGDEAAAAMDDVYVQGGTDGDKNFSGSSSLIVKYDTGAQSYTRKSLMKFDLEHVPGDAEHIYLSNSSASPTSSGLSVSAIFKVTSLVFPVVPAVFTDSLINGVF